MKEIGYAHGGLEQRRNPLRRLRLRSQGDMEAYAASFAVKTLKG
jgi:hypothetical protein